MLRIFDANVQAYRVICCSKASLDRCSQKIHANTPEFCFWRVAKYMAERWDEDCCAVSTVSVIHCFCQCYFPALLDFFAGIVLFWGTFCFGLVLRGLVLKFLDVRLFFPGSNWKWKIKIQNSSVQLVWLLSSEAGLCILESGCHVFCLLSFLLIIILV